MCGLLVDHLDVTVQGMFVDCAVLADTALEGSLLQMDRGVVPLKGELVGSSIITNRTLMVGLRIFLMNISYVSF